MSRAADALEQIVADPLFDEAIAAAGVALEGESCTVSEAIYDHPDGYLALMALMNATGRHPARRLIRLVSANGRLPACRAPQAEAALQFVIATQTVVRQAAVRADEDAAEPTGRGGTRQGGVRQ